MHSGDQDITQRGEALYESSIRTRLKKEDHGKFVVVDVETGAFEMDADELAALRRAKAAGGRADHFYLLRVGYPTAYRLGRAGVGTAAWLL